MKSDTAAMPGITKSSNGQTTATTKSVQNKELINICEVVRQEITSFQRKNCSIGLHQSAILIDVDETSASADVLVECADNLKTTAPGWSVRVVRNANHNGQPAIFSLISRSTVTKAIAQTGLITIPASKSKVIGFSGFLLFMAIFFVPFMTTGHWTPPSATAVTIAFFCAIIFGYITCRIVQNQVISKYTIPASVIETLKLPAKGDSLLKCFSSMANNVCNELPMVILIENHSLSDQITSNVLQQITSSNQLTCTGALIWVVFTARKGNAEDIFSRCSFPVKRYALKDGVS